MNTPLYTVFGAAMRKSTLKKRPKHVTKWSSVDHLVTHSGRHTGVKCIVGEKARRENRSFLPSLLFANRGNALRLQRIIVFNPLPAQLLQQNPQPTAVAAAAVTAAIPNDRQPLFRRDFATVTARPTNRFSQQKCPPPATTLYNDDAV